MSTLTLDSEPSPHDPSFATGRPIERCPPEWVHRARWIFLLGALLVFVFSGADWVLYGSTAPFWWLLSARVALSATSVWLVLRLRRTVRALWLERTVLAWLLAIAAYCLTILWTRPVDTLAPFLVNAVLAAFLCIVYPLPAWKAILAPALISLGSLAALVLREVPADTLATMALWAIFLVGPLAASVIGAAVRRAELRLMASLAREQELRGELDAALRELGTVEGIVGICLHCKKLRDRHDQWQPIERFLAKIGRVRFSHGICPTCLAERYADEPPDRQMASEPADPPGHG